MRHLDRNASGHGPLRVPGRGRPDIVRHRLVGQNTAHYPATLARFWRASHRLRIPARKCGISARTSRHAAFEKGACGKPALGAELHGLNAAVEWSSDLPAGKETIE